ncbi:MAG: N-acetyl-gamma-glutamyl-phosphate reductase [Pirellulales bacterium]|nr:N-acetyl-gamma-glutamyl-phosphate reductase [Pirellulales bacterium]
MKIRIAILGARGYTARQLIELLLRHPGVEITCLSTRDSDRPPLAEVHPVFAGRLDLRLENSTPDSVADQADCVFSCLPHAASAAFVAQLLDRGLRVVDFSADYRLTDPDVYQTWYGVAHPDPDRLATAVYGLPELFRESIRTTQLVANPGCYPTSAILGLAPLLQAGCIAADGLVIDSKSGVSGAGRNPKPNLHFPECNESVAAYSIGSHRHMPEVDQLLSRVAGQTIEVIFTPHLIPMDRGILTTTYGTASDSCSPDQCMDRMKDFYSGEPFVRVVDKPPTTKQVLGTNYCDIYTTWVRGKIVVVTVIDNLIKGASGAAVQNFNIMYGFDETTALL